MTSGGRNTGLGTRGLVLTEGSENVFVGKDAGDSHTVINEAVLIGHNGHTINASTTSDGTIGIGASLGSLTTGAENTAIGYEALDSITTVGYNGIGYHR